MKNKLEVSIITPTYNRAYTLKRLYDSLKNQTSKSFEWIVIDDGSKDETEKILKKFKDENYIRMRYIKQENKGKHVAVNKGIDMAEGKMTFIVDSDDYLIEDAVEIIIKKEKEISNKKCFSGMVFNRGYDRNTIWGKTFKGEYIDITKSEEEKYNIKGEKVRIFYTEILKKNRFPEFKGEKFLTEAVLWNRIASQGYKSRYFQDIIYIGDYLDDGLTKKGNKRFKNSPNGLLLYIKEYIEFKGIKFPRKLLLYEMYSEAIYENKNIKKAARDLEITTFSLECGIILRKIIKLFKINNKYKRYNK